MDLEKIKDYLQNYLNDVILPNINTDESLVEPITMNVTDVLKGSYQPPIYHVFIDMEPNWQGSYTKKIEGDVIDFMKILSIPYRIKIYWNKRPSFKDPKK